MSTNEKPAEETGGDEGFWSAAGDLDEAKKLADELADHDLIWLCDKHTRARASLEC